MFLDTSGLTDGEIYLKLDETRDGDKLRGRAPTYFFGIFRCRDDERLGLCVFRAAYNVNTYYGGHIGYEIKEKHRGRNYAAKAARLLFKLALRHRFKYVIITCDPENIASNKTCLALGGEIIQRVRVPHWHEMWNGDPDMEINRYRINLTKGSKKHI